MPEPVNKNVLSQIKYEYNNQNSIFPKSYPIILDVDAAKTVFDYCYLTERLDGLRGFIQNIFYNPFGFLLISEIQVMKF